MDKQLLTTSASLTAVFDTDLERAFKTPMLCDVTRIHTGSWVTPQVTHTTDDSTWGRVGGSRRIHMVKTPLFKGGEASLDRVLERVENDHWIIEVCEFKTWSMGFVKFQGEWYTRALPEGGVHILYKYTLFSTSRVLHPLHWLFTKLIWRSYMKQVLGNIRTLTVEQAPYMHA